jgi:phosphohistidine swiveling domain-containing protein
MSQWRVGVSGRGCHGAEEMGGKAWNLRRMEEAGVRVPTWVLIPPKVPERLADPIGIPTDLAQEVRAVLEEAGLGTGQVAVRSSAVGEDAAAASFAGQFETVLGVDASDEQALWEAVRRVWASAGSERVRAYGDQDQPPRMGVLIQAMVDAAAAGVAFSADPVSGDRSLTLVSAVHGLGDALVAGEVDAATYQIRSRAGNLTIESRDTGRQDRGLWLGEGGTQWRILESPEKEPCSDGELLEVARAALHLASVMGGPQDVEWAFRDEAHGGRSLLILQTRPISTLRTGERRVWDNSNIVESFAGVTTPLTFSFARRVYQEVYIQFCRVMGVEEDVIQGNRSVFSAMLGLISGRVYYNLLNWYRLLSFLPGYKFNRGFMERMMGVRERLSDPPPPPGTAGRALDFLKMLRAVLGIVVASVRLKKTVPSFHARVERSLSPLAKVDLSQWDPGALAALFRNLERELLEHWQPPLVNDFFAMICFGVLNASVERWLPGEPHTIVNALLAGEGGMISTEPAREVMRLAGEVAGSPELTSLFQERNDEDLLRILLDPATGNDQGPEGSLSTSPVPGPFSDHLRGYLQRFGERCANELKLETITLREDPTFLISTVRSYWLAGNTDPEASRARELAIRGEAELRASSALGPVRRPLFRAILGRARARIRDRENLRFERARVFGVVRRIFLGLGHSLARSGRLTEQRDVVWLTAEEVLGWAEGTGSQADLKGLAEARRREFQGYKSLPAPPDRFETFGPPTEDLPVPPSGTSLEGDLQGIGCCPGVVRGPVRVVWDPGEAGNLEGAILVAERTDPGWTLLFPSAAGLLVQRGSLLSHSAIVAREMALPCVVSIPHLMDTLEDGEVVEMDGTTGVVRRFIDGTDPSPSNPEEGETAVGVP